MSALFCRSAISLSKAFQSLLSSPAARPLASSGSIFSRSFNTNGQIRELQEDYRDIASNRSVSRRRADGFPAYISDSIDPIVVPRTVSQLLNIMDSLFDGPFPAAAARGVSGMRRGWDAREDNDALYLRLDMPGLGKENVKVTAEQGTLVIKGELEAEAGEEENHRRYSTRIDLGPEIYKLDAIKAEMKNGVLKVIVPKVKLDEGKGVFNVNID